MSIFHNDCLVSGQRVGDAVLAFTADGLEEQNGLVTEKIYLEISYTTFQTSFPNW